MKLVQLGGTISIAVTPKYLNGRLYMVPELFLARDIYLIFSILGFLLSICVLIFFSYNIKNRRCSNYLSFNLIVINAISNQLLFIN